MSAEVHEDPVFGYRYRLSREGDVLRVEMWIDPGGATAEHVHPRIEERFEVLEGEVTFRVDGDRQVAGPGGKAVVKPGSRHAFENSGTGVAHVVAEAEPAMTLQQCLEDAARLAQAGRYTKRGTPRGLRGLLETADFADRYRDVTVTTFPPPALQRIAIPPLARLQRRRTRKAAA